MEREANTEFLDNLSTYDMAIAKSFEQKNPFAGSLTTVRLKGRSLQNPTVEIIGGPANGTKSCYFAKSTAKIGGKRINIERVVSNSIDFCPKNFDLNNFDVRTKLEKQFLSNFRTKLYVNTYFDLTERGKAMVQAPDFTSKEKIAEFFTEAKKLAYGETTQAPTVENGYVLEAEHKDKVVIYLGEVAWTKLQNFYMLNDITAPKSRLRTYDVVEAGVIVVMLESTADPKDTTRVMNDKIAIVVRGGAPVMAYRTDLIESGVDKNTSNIVAKEDDGQIKTGDNLYKKDWTMWAGTEGEVIVFDDNYVQFAEVKV